MLEPAPQFPDDPQPDSLDVMEVVMAYEEAFDDEVNEEELKKLPRFHTRQELIDYLRKRKKGGE